MTTQDRADTPRNATEWNPTETLYAFLGHLTTRRERLVLSAADDAAPAVEAIEEFRKRHGLPDVREGWAEGIIPRDLAE